MVVQKSWYWDVLHTKVLGLFIVYQGSWILFEYIKILEDNMLPDTEEEMPLKWVFQQDNDPKHTSKRATSWFQTKRIEVVASSIP